MAEYAVDGRTIGLALMKAWGIYELKGVKTITIRLACDEVVSVTIERMLADDEQEKIVELLEKYMLIEKPLNLKWDEFADQHQWKMVVDPENPDDSHLIGHPSTISIPGSSQKPKEDIVPTNTQ